MKSIVKSLRAGISALLIWTLGCLQMNREPHVLAQDSPGAGVPPLPLQFADARARIMPSRVTCELLSGGWACDVAPQAHAGLIVMEAYMDGRGFGAQAGKDAASLRGTEMILALEAGK